MPRNRLIPNCRDTQFLLSSSQDRAVTPLERARVRVHLWTCKACTIFSQQIGILHQAMQKLGKD